MGIKYDEKKQTWQVRCYKRHPVTDLPTKRQESGLKSKAEAKRVEKELVIKLEEFFKQNLVPTWEEAVNQCTEYRHQEGHTKNTIANYFGCLRKNTFKIWAKKRIDKITTEDIRSLIRINLKDMSPSYQCNLLKFVKSTFELAVQSGHIPSNPTPKMKFKIGDKLKDVLTIEQVNYFLSKAKEYESDWYHHWAMALYTGMRSGELYALKWEKVNLENRQIIVDTAWNSKDGFKCTKSGNDRIVEIAPELLTILKELRLSSDDSGFVLPRLSRWKKGSAAMVTRMFLQGIGLPQVRFHDLRATWATVMLSNGVEPIKVMSMGGWESLKTMQIYVRKAGINIKGITDGLNLHNPLASEGKVYDIQSLCSDS